MITAYFIGGPFDLTKRVWDNHAPAPVVAIDAVESFQLTKDEPVKTTVPVVRHVYNRCAGSFMMPESNHAYYNTFVYVYSHTEEHETVTTTKTVVRKRRSW